MAHYSYALADPDTVANGTGTITVSLGGTSVAVGTAFATQLAVGDVIIFGGYAYAVATITDADTMTIATVAKTVAAGASFTFATLINVETLNGAARYPPKSTYRPYTDSLPLANGKVRGFGRPLATWRWGFIPLAVRTSLRVFCNNAKSDVVYVRTRTNEADAYQTFSASIVWPDDEDKDAGRRIRFTLEFKNLVQL